MDITVRIVHDVSPTLQSFLETSMSKITDKIDALNKSLDDAQARILADIQTLQAKIEAGGGTDEDLAALDALRTRIESIDPLPDDTSPTPPA